VSENDVVFVGNMEYHNGLLLHNVHVFKILLNSKVF